MMNSNLLSIGLVCTGLVICNEGISAQVSVTGSTEQAVTTGIDRPATDDAQVQPANSGRAVDASPNRDLFGNTPSNPEQSQPIDQKPPTEIIKVFSMNRIEASSAVEILKQLDKASTTIIADMRTNSVICAGSPDKVQVIAELIEQLDTADSKVNKAADPGASNNPFGASLQAPADPFAASSSAVEPGSPPGSTAPARSSVHATDSEIAALQAQFQSLDQMTQALARQVRVLEQTNNGGNGSELQQLKSRLHQQVARAFETRQQLQRMQMFQLQSKLNAIQHAVNAREGIRETIIQKRIADLLTPEATWNPAAPDTAARTRPNDPFDARKPTATARTMQTQIETRPAPLNAPEYPRTSDTGPQSGVSFQPGVGVQSPDSQVGLKGIRSTGRGEQSPGPRPVAAVQDSSASGLLSMILDRHERLTALQQELAAIQAKMSTLSENHPQSRALKAQLTNTELRISREHDLIEAYESDLETEVTIREAKLNQASAKLEGAKGEAQRMKQLALNGLIQTSELALAEQKVKLFEQELIEAKARVTQYRRVLQILPRLDAGTNSVTPESPANESSTNESSTPETPPLDPAPGVSTNPRGKPADTPDAPTLPVEEHGSNFETGLIRPERDVEPAQLPE